MRAKLGNLIARMRARFTVGRKDYTGTITRHVADDELWAVDPYAAHTEAVAPITIIHDDLVTGREPEVSRERMGEMLDECHRLVGEAGGTMTPSAQVRTPLQANSELRDLLAEGLEVATRGHRYIICSECKKHGKVRPFRTAGTFADHLKSYHGAKDGDAIERLL